MAHECPECGYTCHCGGDIDDIHWGEDPNCNCAYSEWGCGKYNEDDDEWDEDEYYEDMDRLTNLLPENFKQTDDEHKH